MSSCAICDSKKINFLLNWKEYKILKCKNCQLIFTTPIPSDIVLNEFYQGFMFLKPELHKIEREIDKRKKELTRLFELSGQQLKNYLFLDFGGGTGVVFKAASELGLNTYYQDLDQQAEVFTKKHFGLTEEKTIKDLKSSSLKFDYIFSDNVIEHVPNPENFVLNLINQLNTKGTLVIKTPHASNTEIFFNPIIAIKGYFVNALKHNSFIKSLRAYFLRFWHCDPPRHIYSFSKKSFELLMKRESFIHTDYKILFYDIPLFSNTITKKVFTKQTKFSFSKSILFRLLSIPFIPVEIILQSFKWIFVKMKILSPGGIILKIELKS